MSTEQPSPTRTRPRYTLDNIRPELRKILIETNTNITDARDLEALSKVSVRELALFFDEISMGVSRRDAFMTLKNKAVENLVKKQRELQELEKNMNKERELLRRKELEIGERERQLRRYLAERRQRMELRSLDRLKHLEENAKRELE